MIRHPATPPPHSPKAKLTFGRFPVSRSVDYNRDLNHLDITGPRGFHHIRRPRTSAPDRSSIIVAIAGACPNNGTGGAQRSSCGVYFGDSCRETRGFRVDSGPAHPHTNQRAELHAAIAALDAVKPFCEKGGHWGSSTSVDKQCRVTHVVVKSHSSYVVEAVGGGKRGHSPYMEMWMANGFRTAQGLSIKNLDLWRDVLQRLRDVQNLDRIIDMVFSDSVASHSEHETCFMPEKKPLGVSPPRFPDSHMDAYQGDLAFLESPGPAIDPNGGRFVHLRCYQQDPSTLRHVSHCDSLIIAVSGVTANTLNRSAIGVYFGPNNPFNLSLAVPTKYRIGEEGEDLLLPHTTLRAELYGVIAALNAVLPFTHQYRIESPTNGSAPTTLKHVIIKIESGYIVDKIWKMEAQRPLVFHQVYEAGKSDRGCLDHCGLWQGLRQG
ncbi:hypothetical protein K4K56_005756 [Colletotrichum sp. SAR 10_98]|nr:hypothetical protein K4K56_005756 [Colletotrichum sp. SAR 10_98]